MDGQNTAPPQKPWNDDCLVNTNKLYGFNHGFQAVRNGFRNHPQYHCFFLPGGFAADGGMWGVGVPVFLSVLPQLFFFLAGFLWGVE